MRSFVKEYGVPCALFYWITNEAFVIGITALLHYDYLGAGDVMTVVEKLGLSKYANLDFSEKTSWTFFNDSITISARLIANFTAASVFMSLLTPVQLPLSVAVFSLFRRWQRKGVHPTSAASFTNSG